MEKKDPRNNCPYCKRKKDGWWCKRHTPTLKFKNIKVYTEKDLAKARVEGVRGFSDYIVSELIKMPFINVKITKNSVGMMRNKFLKNENTKKLEFLSKYENK